MNKTTALSKKLSKKGFLHLISLPQNDPELARLAFAAGADAVKVHLNVHHHASGTRFGPWAEEEGKIRAIIKEASGPVGLMPGAESPAGPEDMRQALDAGIDFIDIYDHHMPAWMLELPAGLMIAAGHGASLDDVKAMDELGMDFLEASVIPTADYGKPLMVKDLELYRQLATAARSPVFVPTQKKIEPREVAVLKRAGVRGLILGAIVLGNTAESFQANLARFLDGTR
ncbi:MAG: hypothetical protein HY921_10660 [Elusimicrobia bacterium]|nr:hypothetical protein [Elusimicrobiota bacterium]